MPPLPMRREEEESTGGVGTWERTDSPPHPPLLSHNCTQLISTNIKEVEKGIWQIKTRWQHMGFSPIDQVLTSPTPYPSEPCPFHSTLHCCSWLWFILIDVRVYMMPTIMCQIGRYTIGNYPYCRNIHDQNDGGDFSFSSSP